MKIGLRELIFLAMLIAMPVGGWWLVFKPGAEQVSQARAEIEAKRQRLNQLDGVAKHIEDMGPEITRLTEAIAVFEAKLPAEKEVDVVLKQVSQLTAKRQLKPLSVRADKIVKSARYSELPLKMKIQGGFEGYYGFLLDMERLSRITRIPQMKLSKLKDTEGQMEAEFTLSIFFEPQDAGAKLPKVAQAR